MNAPVAAPNITMTHRNIEPNRVIADGEPLKIICSSLIYPFVAHHGNFRHSQNESQGRSGREGRTNRAVESEPLCLKICTVRSSIADGRLARMA